jgi:excisionase family DNA binding protein
MTQWFTVAEAADYVRVSADLIRTAVRLGDLPAYSIGKGREYRLTAEDIDEWMKSRAYEPPKLL